MTSLISNPSRKMYSFSINRRTRKLPHLVLASFACLFGVSAAYADCSPTEFRGLVPVTFPSTVTVSDNAAIGTVIMAVTVPVPVASSGVQYGTCSGGGNVYWSLIAGPAIPNRVGATSVQGVGYTASLSGGGLASPVGFDTAINASWLPGGPGAPTFSSQLYVTVSLVKTGHIVPGPLALNPHGVGVRDVVGHLYVGDRGSSFFNIGLTSNATSVATSASM
ncbi:hypothetical protein [Paraburkholderia sp. BCC1884]|uniref:hypothetical protein n=1 Tax=Paraburkholderia sp. BCC1884 TaxID=2562668 RepID=UPI001181D1A8|nr:hypothetical protein [Paraburkholderia sp. BCC1884]